jgi:peptidoglycan/xylan/chitin deacetylase (PgdA/CDA1 family)
MSVLQLFAAAFIHTAFGIGAVLAFLITICPVFWVYVFIYWVAWRFRYGYPNENVRPILTYHKVEPKLELGGTRRSPGRFRRQMARLRINGWRTTNLEDYIGFLRGETDLPEKVFQISFDDGFSGVLENAAPIMADYGYSGSVHIVTDFVGKDSNWEPWPNKGRYRHLNWEEIRRLAESGWEVGSHGISHRSFLLLDDAELKRELRESKAIIEDNLGRPCDYISLPYGHADKRIVNAAAAAGYSACLGLYVERRNDEDAVRLLHRTAVYVIDGPKAVSAKVGDFGKFMWGVEDLKGRMGGWYADLALRLSLGKKAPQDLIRGRDIYMKGKKGLI